MYIDANKEASLPDKNQYNSIKSSQRSKQISWRTVSEFKEKINRFKNDVLTSRKEDFNDEKDYERKRKKLNYTNCWEEDLSTYGYARCLRSRCNFISNNIRVVKCHYRDCNGVPRFREKHFCSTCQNYLYSSEAHAEHVRICKGFNKYNQTDYKYDRVFRTRKSVSKVPLDRILSWQDQIINQGSACCGYKMCTFISMSMSDLEEHYITCCGVAGLKIRSCAHCAFKYSAEEDYAQHKPRCPRYGRLHHVSSGENNGSLYKIKQIVQPKPELEPGVYRQQRICTQRHIRAWKVNLTNERCARCTFPNCRFIAMSLEDMIRHFSYCNDDRNFARVVCPYCHGRVTSQDILMEHIKRTHKSDRSTASKRVHTTSDHVSDSQGIWFSNDVFGNDEMDRYRAWEMQITKFGYAYCMELNCNYMGKSLKELEVHLVSCRETVKKRFSTCRKCRMTLPTDELGDHRYKCSEVDEEQKYRNEKKKLRSEWSPVKRQASKDLKTYSRKRKVDVDLNNADCGYSKTKEGYLSSKKTEKEPKLTEWRVINERKTQVAVGNENEIEVIELEVERVETDGTGEEELYCSDDTLLQPELGTTIVEVEVEDYDPDKNEIEVFEERVEKDEMKEGRSNRNEIEIIEAELESVETVDLVEEEQEKVECEDELEKVETQEKVENKVVESENKDEEPEKVITVETVEDEPEKVENEDERLEDEEPEKVEMVNSGDKPQEVDLDERKKEEVVISETVDEAKKPEVEDEKQDSAESVIPNDSEDGRKKESTNVWNGRKEDKSKNGSKDEDVDSFGLDESDEDEEDYRMEIDEGIMSTIFETLDDDFDKCNPPYTIIGNEIELFEGNENTQETVIDLPNDDSQTFLINEDTGTLDRSEPSSTDNEQWSDNEGAEGDKGVQDSGQGGSGQGVDQSGEQNDDTTHDGSNDGNSGRENDNSRDGGKKKDDNDNGDGDGKKSEDRKKVEKGEDSDNAEESEEKDNDGDEEKKDDTEIEETNERREKIEMGEGSSKVKSMNEEEDEDEDSTQTEKPKEVKKTRRSGKMEGSRETEKDKVKEGKKPGRKSKKWSEDDGNEEYIPKGLARSAEGSENEGESIAKTRGRRGQVKPNNEVAGVMLVLEPQVKKTVQEVKCGKCDFTGSRYKFEQHNWMKHFGLSWVDGEKEVDLNDYEEVTRLVRAAFRVTKIGVCEVCKAVKRSYMGFVSHIQKCGKSRKETNALKIKCPHCPTKCLKYSLKTHLYVFHSGKYVVKSKSKNKDENTDTDAEADQDSDAEIDEPESVTGVSDQSQAQITAQDQDQDQGQDQDQDQDQDQNQNQNQDQDQEKVKTDEEKEGDETTLESGPQEHVVSSSKRKSALKAATMFQEAFKDNVEVVEEEKARESGYVFYEKGKKIPRLCYKLCNLWYALKRKKKMIPCRHENCNILSSDVKQAKKHHFTCPLLPSAAYFCEVCEYYSVEESEIQSHLKSSHKRSKRRGKVSKEDADMDFSENEEVEVEEEEWEDEAEGDDEDEEESENDFEECDSVYERQNKKTTKKKSKKKEEEDESKAERKGGSDSEEEEDTTELVHKQNFFEREKLGNVRGDEFYSNALEMTREFEEGCEKNGGSSSQAEEEDDEEEEEEEEAGEEDDDDDEDDEEESSEIDYSRVWPQLHTESEDWCHVSREVSSAHLPEILESISVSFIKDDKDDLNWMRFKRFDGDIVEDVPVMFVGGSVRSMSWCKVSFRRTLEKSVKQYLAVSTAKNIDHLTDVHKDREPFSWSLVQIWDCGALENCSPVEPPKFCLGIFQEGGEIWDMLWFPEDTYGKGSNGKLTRIGILATASDDGAVRIWSICDPSQIVFNTRLPLFITEPLVKLIIDNFLEDSCVRLSIGRDGIIAGGYVNGCLAVWNLKNITSKFSEKIGKCVVIKPHLIIQAHRTSITALTFCPNNNRYITSGGLDRVVKLWDLESPWVPVEQYQRELCLDNIWPRNWPMNIYNFEDVYPNNRKGVIRFVKDVISSKHSPCLILDNTCLSLSFSDWLNSICGCNNTGEVKIRFLKNFLRDQDKRQEKNQSTLSSLRLEKLSDEDDSDWELSAAKDDGSPKTLPKSYGVLNAQYGIVIKDHNVKDKGKPLADTFHPEDFPIRAINKVCFNPNFKSFTHIAVGYNCGLIRIQRLNELQFNNAIKSFSENAKKPRL